MYVWRESVCVCVCEREREREREREKGRERRRDWVYQGIVTSAKGAQGLGHRLRDHLGPIYI